MIRTRVKICGITCSDDALVAAHAGADAVGLIFHPPAFRAIKLDAAETIVSELPPLVTPVGLFLDSPAYSIANIARKLKLQYVQLHGHEVPEDVKELSDYFIIKAIHVRPGRLREALDPWRDAVIRGLPNLRALVLETGWTSAKGGTGIENDWDQIEEVQCDGGFGDLPPIILAGGLLPSNVGDVIERLRPYAVDVSSGVEETKGRKSPERVEAFMCAIRKADHNCRNIPTV